MFGTNSISGSKGIMNIQLLLLQEPDHHSPVFQFYFIASTESIGIDSMPYFARIKEHDGKIVIPLIEVCRALF